MSNASIRSGLGEQEQTARDSAGPSKRRCRPEKVVGGARSARKVVATELNEISGLQPIVADVYGHLGGGRLEPRRCASVTGDQPQGSTGGSACAPDPACSLFDGCVTLREQAPNGVATRQGGVGPRDGPKAGAGAHQRACEGCGGSLRWRPVINPRGKFRVHHPRIVVPCGNRQHGTTICG